jgi:hypothetical protein
MLFALESAFLASHLAWPAGLHPGSILVTPGFLARSVELES